MLDAPWFFHSVHSVQSFNDVQPVFIFIFQHSVLFNISFDCVSAFCAVEERFWSSPPPHRVGKQILGDLAGGSLRCVSSRRTCQRQSFHTRYISTAYQVSSPSLKISDDPGQQIILRTETSIRNHFMVDNTYFKWIKWMVNTVVRLGWHHTFDFKKKRKNNCVWM